MTEEKLKRINELYKKQKTLGLSFEEKEEQRQLRQEYLASVRRNLKRQLDNIDIINEDGTIENLGDKYNSQRPDGRHF